MPRAQLRKNHKAVELGKAKVENQEVERAAVQQIGGYYAVVNPVDGVARVL